MFFTPSFKNVEGHEVVTLPNAMAAARGAGGLALGIGMAFNNLDPTFVVASAAALAATDAEGSTIIATRRWPRLQRLLRIMPSSLGRVIDPIADKIYALGIIGGGLANGTIPLEQGLPVMAVEGVTSVATALVSRDGHVPEVSKAGKAGMIARITMLAGDLGAEAISGGVHEALADAGTVSAGAAVVLGIMSCYNIIKR